MHPVDCQPDDELRPCLRTLGEISIALGRRRRSGVAGFRKHERTSEPAGDIRPTTSALWLNPYRFENPKPDLGRPGVKNGGLQVDSIVDAESMTLPFVSGDPRVQVDELLVAQTISCLFVSERCGRPLHDESSQPASLGILVGQSGQRFHMRDASDEERLGLEIGGRPTIDGLHEKISLVVELAIDGACCKSGPAGNVSDGSLSVSLYREELGSKFNQQGASGLSFRATVSSLVYS